MARRRKANVNRFCAVEKMSRHTPPVAPVLRQHRNAPPYIFDDMSSRLAAASITVGGGRTAGAVSSTLILSVMCVVCVVCVCVSCTGEFLVEEGGKFSGPVLHEMLQREPLQMLHSSPPTHPPD
jgi:hypothetical protein